MVNHDDRATQPNKILQQKIQLLTDDQIAGLSVQERLLPDSPANLNGFNLQHRIFPSVIMSGDAVDYFALDEHRVLFYLVDVAGHGAAAAMVGMVVSAVARQMRALLLQPNQTAHKSTADLLNWFNKTLLEWQFEQHLTMFLGILDAKNGILEYSNAAHFPGVIYATNDASSALETDALETGVLEMGGLPLGICETNYALQQLKFDNSLQLVLFSDGVLEIMNQASILEKEASLLALLQCNGTNIEQWIRALGLDDDLDMPDDIAVLTVER